MNIMGSCVSFQIKVQILAFYTDVCMALTWNKSNPRFSSKKGHLFEGSSTNFCNMGSKSEEKFVRNKESPYGPYARPYKRPKFELLSGKSRNSP